MSEEFTVSFSIPGRPVPAVRMTNRSKFAARRAHRYLEYKKKVGYCFREQVVGFGPFREDLRFEVHITILTMKPEAHAWDVDNISKTVLDGLNEVVWKDDKQVDGLSVFTESALTKRQERVFVTIHGYPTREAHYANNTPTEAGTTEGLSGQGEEHAGEPGA